MDATPATRDQRNCGVRGALWSPSRQEVTVKPIHAQNDSPESEH